jgi:hypothetical protein
LTVALRIALDMPGSDWEALVSSAPIVDARQRLLLSADERSLDLMAAELNEFRGFM